MKSMMINSVCGIRSTGRICTDLAEALAAAGHEARIAYGREDVPERFRDISYRVGSEAGVRLHGVRARLTDGEGTGSRRATARLIEYMERYDPDVVHLHNIHGYYLNTELLFGWLRSNNVRTVWTLHDCWAFTGHAAFCEGADCERWRSGCERCAYESEYPKSLVCRSGANWRRKKALYGDMENLTVVTPSRWLEDLARQSFLSGCGGIMTLHNGIDLSAFYPRDGGELRKKLGLGNKTVGLGVAAVWNRRKGLDDIIRLSRMSDGSIVYIVIGLERGRIDSLPPNMIGIERTNDKNELAEYYSLADALVMPTYEDNFPTVNIEALACGTPVLTYRTGGSPEAVAEGCGAVVPKGDTDAVHRIMSGIRDGFLGSAECSQKCAAHAQLFSKEKMCEGYLKIYEGQNDRNKS